MFNNKAYDEEELINVDNIDLNNQEAIEEIRSYIIRMFDDVSECMNKWEGRQSEALERLDSLSSRTDVQRVEHRKTILSKLLYVIGSAFSPETMPVEMYGKQEMPEDKRKEFDDLHEEAEKRKARIKESSECLKNAKNYTHSLKRIS